MYNRYIPQSDGTYQRSRIPEKQSQYRPAAQQSAPIPCPESAGHGDQPYAATIPPRSYRHKPVQQTGNAPVSSFLRQLLPGNFDTVDLIVVLLLLLMSGDCAEDQNTALLTLALYLFL